MSAHRVYFSPCDQCRERKRRCNRAQPKCSSCNDLDVECFYRPASDPHQSQLVQELSGIREKLDHIAPLVENLGNPPTFWKRAPYAHLFPQSQVPPITIKSQSLMQTIGILSGFPALIYQLEDRRTYTPGAYVEPSLLRLSEDKITEIIRIFTERVQVWYPILHPSITNHFFEMNSSCFSPSTKSCSCLLVASIAFILSKAQSESFHFDAALSMLPIVLREDSMISIQCLVLLGIYYACRMQPLHSYNYIRIASFRINSLLKREIFSERSTDWQLITRIYWVIYIIGSETSMHLNLSAAYHRPRPGGSRAPIPFPTNDNDIDILAESNISRSWVMESPDPPRQLQRDTLYFSRELHLQQLLDTCMDSTTGDSCTLYPNNTPSGEDGFSLQLLLDSLPPIPAFSGKSMSQDIVTHQRVALLRAKYHAYEISSYWPVIYHAIVVKGAGSELHSYASLFIESIVSFLAAANVAVRGCIPKSWSLSASLFIASMVAIWTVDNLYLQSLLSLRLRKYLEDTLETLKQFNELSPSVKHMAEVLDNRLQEIDFS